MSLLTPIHGNASGGGNILLNYSKINDTTAVIDVSSTNVERIRLPDGNWTTQNNFTYTVNKNGNYYFEGRTYGFDGLQKSVVINDLNKDIAVSNHTAVTLNLSADDTLSGISKMRFSNNNSSWSEFENYNNKKNWNLEPGDGIKKVYVQYQDAVGNNSDIICDTVYLDNTPPDVSFTINGGNMYTNNKDVNLSFNITDNYSDIKYIYISNDNINFTQISNTAQTKWTIPGTIGINTVYIKALDTANNMSGVVSQKIYYDNILPYGTILINDGADATNTRDVWLTLNFGDNESGVSKVRIIEDNNVYQFPEVPTNPVKIPWTLNMGLTGQVTMEITDKAGNIYTTESNVINIITLKITAFKLNNVINPLYFNSSNPYISKAWPFTPQPMLAGANIDYEIDYDLYNQGDLSSNVDAFYTIEIIGDNYKKELSGKYPNHITNPVLGFTKKIKIPDDAPTNAKVYLRSYVRAELLINDIYNPGETKTFEQIKYFPGSEESQNEMALIGYIQGNIQETLRFNEVK